MGSALHQIVSLLLYLAKVYAPSTAVEPLVRLMIAPPTHKREACVGNMAHTASAVSTTAAPTHTIKVAFVGGTAGEMGSALHQVVSPLLFLAKVCAPSTAVVNHVWLLAAPRKYNREACARSMAQWASAWSATAAPTHKRKVAFVGGTAGEMGSALHQVV